MPKLQNHLRDTLLAGIFSTVPLAVTAFIVWWIDDKTRLISRWLFHHDIPVVGVLIAVATIYLAGLITTSLMGKYFLRRIDSLLSNVPVLRQLYGGWKQIALTPGGTEGIYSHVALIPDETGHMRLLGFTSGRPIEGDPDTLCIYVPGSPNPVTGRLFLVPRGKCQILNLSPEDAFKFILSTGNYVPPEIGRALAASPPPAAPSSIESRGNALQGMDCE